MLEHRDPTPRVLTADLPFFRAVQQPRALAPDPDG
jgi:hypothetical protein